MKIERMPWFLLDSRNAIRASGMAVLTVLVVVMLLAWSSMASAGSNTYATAGTYSWTAPSGVTSVTVETWGGGGGGGAATGRSAKGGGGAGGQYASKVITVVPGNTYAVVVGTGGVGGTSTLPNGGVGGDSSFGSNLVLAKGGAGGLGGIADYSGGSGGSGSAAGAVGSVVYAGGNGSVGSWNYGTSGAGGGGAGSTGPGGNASGVTGGAGTAVGGGAGASGRSSGGACTNLATAAGGGGCGGNANNRSDRSGGAGAVGQVVITYPGAPIVTTGAASGVALTAATLNGTVTSNGASTAVSFEYGLTSSYGSSVTATQSPLVAGAVNAAVSAAISGLTCNTTYHYRVKGANSIGVTNGSDQTFTTGSCTIREKLPSLFNSWAGTVNFTGTQKSLRTQPNSSDPCSVTTGTTTATLSGLPTSGANTILAAYLYWAASGSTPDYYVTFEGNTVSANRLYTSSSTGAMFFSGVADVTSIVAAKGNGSYSFSGLTIDNSYTYCNNQSVLGGWVLLVVYSNPADATNRVLNLYEGFSPYQYSSITVNMSNFKIPSPLGTATGKAAHITWEGDPTLYGGGEDLTFNGTVLADANNPQGNQFNSVGTITTPADSASYGVDFDAYTIGAPIIAAGQTSATTVYSSGQDQVFLSAEILAVPNVAVADLAITMTREGALVPGSSATYTLNVSNNGPATETGPITVTDTLPAGLSFVAASGTGWSCSAAGQLVTCTRTGSLAGGAAADAITVTVAVSGSASGTITNTASVAGSLFDNVSGNNTASNSYSILLSAAYAYYKLDGDFTDSSGNGRTAASLGGVAASTLTPASGIKGDTCKGVDIPTDTAVGTVQGVDTGIPVGNLGNTGSLAFWYRNNEDWITYGGDSDDRTLVDGTGSNANDYFWLALTQEGALRFSLLDLAGGVRTAQSPATPVLADSWSHIAISWNFGTSGFLRVYVNGTLVGETTGSFSRRSGYGNLLFGDTRSNTIDRNRGNSADGVIDEISLYSIALSPAQIQQLMNGAHACTSVVDHYELSLPSSSISCLPTTVTVTACADASSPCTNRQAAVSGTTASLATTAGALGSPVTFGANGVATGTLTYPEAANGSAVTVTLSNEGAVASGPRKCCPDGGSCSVANACQTTFSTAGFIFSAAANAAETTVANQVAGVGFGPYWLRAVKTGTTTKTCEAALTSPHPVTFSYLCNNPSSCSSGSLLSVGASSVASGGTVLNLAFDANGNASLGNLSFADVGNIGVRATATAGGASLTGMMKGSGGSNFVVSPYAFVVTDIKQTTAPYTANPAAADASGGRFVRAGEAFSATATAVNASCAAALATYTLASQIPASCVTPNFGKESTPESVTLTSALATGLPDLTQNPALGNPAAFGAFNNGAATNTSLSWGEVGIIRLTPSIGDADYLGAGNRTGAASGNVGRFVPDHFALTAGTATPACGSFTYFGQDGFSTPFTLTAQNMAPANGTTRNYTGSFAKLGLTTWTNFGFAASAGPAPAASATAPTGTWDQGVAAVVAKHQVSRPATPAAPTAIMVSARPVDSDGVTLPAAVDVQTAATPLRYGRAQLLSANGSELLPLPVTLRLQYWAGAAGWQINTADTCTAIQASDFAFSFPTATGNNLSACRTAITVGGTVPNYTLSLSAPGTGREGWTDITLNLGAVAAGSRCTAVGGAGAASTTANAPWLQHNWTGTVGNPQARATFGKYRSGPVIYRRELY